MSRPSLPRRPRGAPSRAALGAALALAALGAAALSVAEPAAAQTTAAPAAPATVPAPGARAPRALSIAAALRTLESGDSVRVAGRATVAGGVFHTRVFDVAIDDGSAGVRVFATVPPATLAEGDSLEAVGVVRGYRGTTELVAASARVVPGPRRLVAPLSLGARPVGAADAGRLVRVAGRVLSLGSSEGGRWARLVTAHADTVTLWAPAPHAAPPDFDAFRVGDRLDVTGIVAVYQDGPEQPVVWQIIPRRAADVRTEGVPRRWYEAARRALVVLLVGGALFWVLLRAVTRRQLRELRETEARYRQLLELCPEAVFVHDGSTVLFANPAAARLLGASHERTLAGRPLAWFVPPERIDAFGRPGTPGTRGRVRLGGGTGGATAEAEITASPCRYHDRAAVVVLARDVSAQMRHERELQALALLDELTGLPNRRGFSAFAEQELRRAREHGRGAVVLVVDLVGLKRINDEHGHAAGDVAIRTVARAMRALAGETGVLARWGGDEFVALLFDGDDRATARAMVERLAELVRAESPAGLAYTVRASAGTAALGPAEAITVSEGITLADADLYRMRGEPLTGHSALPQG